MTPNVGSGPGAITPDGCAVELYARLPTMGEPDVVHEQLAPAGSVLDLGSGVGRVADPLVELGHRVVAVDESADMLARVRAATTVRSRIESLRLPERFDASLLASFLLNTPDPEQRREFLTTAQYHLSPVGVVLVQWHPPEWFDSLKVGGTYSGGARYVPGRRTQGNEGQLITTLNVEALSNGLLTAAVTYDLDDHRWTHAWQTQRLTVHDLEAALRVAGLRFAGFLTPDRTWLRASAAATH